MNNVVTTDTASHSQPSGALRLSASSLADLLKDATWSLHKKAETSGVIADLINKRSNIAAYLALLKSLLPVYEALETEPLWLDRWPSLKPFVNDQIYRSEALKEDLANILAQAKNESLMDPAMEISAMIDYAEHIKTSSQKRCAGMLGHLYVRYLGDLNGGRILQRLVGEGLTLSPAQLTFYQFPKISDLTVFKDQFRIALNHVHLTPRQKQHAIDAAREGFAATIAASVNIHSRFAQGSR
ncbi:MAG: biliverdin-producing heme oxygenase [Lysobacterales bacterium]